MHQNETYRLPAEWEPQSGVQLTWPHEDTDWAYMLSDILHTYEEIAHEISKREPLLVVGPPSNDTWARDHAFITLLPAGDEEERNHRSPLLLDFCFNGWGEKFESALDNHLNRRIYDEGRVKGQYVDHQIRNLWNVNLHALLSLQIEQLVLVALFNMVEQFSKLGS